MTCGWHKARRNLLASWDHYLSSFLWRHSKELIPICGFMCQRGPFWTPITPQTGSFFHAETQFHAQAVVKSLESNLPGHVVAAGGRGIGQPKRKADANRSNPAYNKTVYRDPWTRRDNSLGTKGSVANGRTVA